jgi:low affinity Fe/Cu permease
MPLSPRAEGNSAAEIFRYFARKTSDWLGSPVAFWLAGLSIVVWALLGPHYEYSDTWQLVINTATTVVTFLMVFLIQNTQNRDAKAVHLKLDELLRAVKGARTGLVRLEELTEDQLTALQQEFTELQAKTKHRLVRPLADAEVCAADTEPDSRVA